MVLGVPNDKNLKYLRFDTCHVQCTFQDDLCPIIQQIQHYLSLECFLKPSNLILRSPQIFYKNSFVLGGTMKSMVACTALLFFRLVCNRILQVIDIHVTLFFFFRWVRLDPILTQDPKCTWYFGQAWPRRLYNPLNAFRVGSGVQVGFIGIMALCSALVIILKMMIVLCFLRIQAFHKLPKHRNWDLTTSDFEWRIASHKPQTKFQKLKTFEKYVLHYMYTITSIYY